MSIPDAIKVVRRLIVAVHESRDAGCGVESETADAEVRDATKKLLAALAGHEPLSHEVHQCFR